MKSVLVSIKPYYVFLIIAHKMGWDIPQEKTIEVRKDFPKDKAWNKVVHIYCSKDKKSFNLIPAPYQPLMKKFVGKVIGEFVCDKITDISVVVRNCNEDYNQVYHNDECKGSCLTWKELQEYGKGKPLYDWHISDLKIYDKPKELFDFVNYDKYQACKERNCFSDECWICDNNAIVVRPPQSWCYVEIVGE